MSVASQILKNRLEHYLIWRACLILLALWLKSKACAIVQTRCNNCVLSYILQWGVFKKALHVSVLKLLFIKRNFAMKNACYVTLNEFHFIYRSTVAQVCYVLCTGRTRVQIPASEIIINSE